MGSCGLTKPHVAMLFTERKISGTNWSILTSWVGFGQSCLYLTTLFKPIEVLTWLSWIRLQKKKPNSRFLWIFTLFSYHLSRRKITEDRYSHLVSYQNHMHCLIAVNCDNIMTFKVSIRNLRRSVTVLNCFIFCNVFFWWDVLLATNSGATLDFWQKSETVASREERPTVSLKNDQVAELTSRNELRSFLC